MIKKLKNLVAAEQKKRHMRWVAKNLPVVTLEVSDNITWQMVTAGARIAEINKWRVFRGLDRIVCYTRRDGKMVRWLTYVPSPEKQSEMNRQGEQMFMVY